MVCEPTSPRRICDWCALPKRTLNGPDRDKPMRGSAAPESSPNSNTGGFRSDTSISTRLLLLFELFFRCRCYFCLNFGQFQLLPTRRLWAKIDIGRDRHSQLA